MSTKGYRTIEILLNWVKKLKTFNNSLNKGVGPWEETCDCLDNYLREYNLKQLGWMCPKIP